jgi:hypothetical protein
MKLNPNEQFVLTAWSKGLAGASQRLARRAWWVLQDRSKTRTSVTGGGAWANAVEAHKWVINFHAMGLVGLVDAPRVGRPMVHSEAVQDAQSRLERVEQRQLGGSGSVKLDLLKNMTRQERESLWRQSRTKGQSVVRDISGKTIALSVPHELKDVLAVVLIGHLKILAFLEKSENLWSGYAGNWIGVPPIKGVQLGRSETKRSSLLSAMSLDVQGAQTANKIQARSKWLVVKAVEHIKEIAGQHPQKVSVAVIFDQDTPKPFIKLLQKLRANKLWAYQNSRIPGLLKQLHIYAYEENWGFAVQATLATNLSGVGANALAEFQDLLTMKRGGEFCWVRVPDGYHRPLVNQNPIRPTQN